jgi:hypothetical protein
MCAKVITGILGSRLSAGEASFKCPHHLRDLQESSYIVLLCGENLGRVARIPVVLNRLTSDISPNWSRFLTGVLSSATEGCDAAPRVKPRTHTAHTRRPGMSDSFAPAPRRGGPGPCLIDVPPHLTSDPFSTLSLYAPSHPRYVAASIGNNQLSAPCSAPRARPATAYQRRPRFAAPSLASSAFASPSLPFASSHPTSPPPHSARSPGIEAVWNTEPSRSPTSDSVTDELGSSDSYDDYDDDFELSHELSPNAALLKTPQRSPSGDGSARSSTSPSFHVSPSPPLHSSSPSSTSTSSLSPSAAPSVHRPPPPKGSISRLGLSPGRPPSPAAPTRDFNAGLREPGATRTPRRLSQMSERRHAGVVPVSEGQREQARAGMGARAETGTGAKARAGTGAGVGSQTEARKGARSAGRTALSGSDAMDCILAARLSRAVVLTAQQQRAEISHARALAIWERERAARGEDASHRSIRGSRTSRAQSGRRANSRPATALLHDEGGHAWS